MANKDVMKIIFTKIDKYSKQFINQIADADVKKIQLDFASLGSIWIWKNGEWIDGVWEDGIWENGTWYDGTWENGVWEDGTWKYGIWWGGHIFNPDSDKFEYSNLSPNKCKWSLSYGK